MRDQVKIDNLMAPLAPGYLNSGNKPISTVQSGINWFDSYICRLYRVSAESNR